MGLRDPSMAARTGVVALLLAAFPVTAAPTLAGTGVGVSGSGRVVVNEFAPSGLFGSSTDEFVELRNTSDQTVALHDWDLTVCHSPSNSSLLLVFGPDDEIPAGGHLLIANVGASRGTPDIVYSGVDVPEDGGWLLHDPFSGYTDGVGLGSGLDCTEGDPAPKCDWAIGEAVTRDEQDDDTDDNLVDFTCQPRTPGS